MKISYVTLNLTEKVDFWVAVKRSFFYFSMRFNFLSNVRYGCLFFSPYSI